MGAVALVAEIQGLRAQLAVALGERDEARARVAVLEAELGARRVRPSTPVGVPVPPSVGCDGGDYPRADR